MSIRPFKFHFNRNVRLDHFIVKNHRGDLRVRLQKLALLAQNVGLEEKAVFGITFGMKPILTLACVDKNGIFPFDLGFFKKVARLEIAVEDLAGNKIADLGLHDGLPLLHAQKMRLQNFERRSVHDEKDSLVRSV